MIAKADSIRSSDIPCPTKWTNPFVDKACATSCATVILAASLDEAVEVVNGLISTNSTSFMLLFVLIDFKKGPNRLLHERLIGKDALFGMVSSFEVSFFVHAMRGCFF